MKWVDYKDDGGEDRCSRRKVGYEEEVEKGGWEKKERKKEREEELGQMLHGNARLLIGCRDSAGYLTFTW